MLSRIAKLFIDKKAKLDNSFLQVSAQTVHCGVYTVDYNAHICIQMQFYIERRSEDIKNLCI